MAKPPPKPGKGAVSKSPALDTDTAAATFAYWTDRRMDRTEPLPLDRDEPEPEPHKEGK